MKKFIDDLIENGFSDVELVLLAAFAVINITAAIIHIVTF